MACVVHIQEHLFLQPMLGELAVAKKSAVRYLEEQMARLRNSSYHMAITTYALKLAGSIQAETGWTVLQTMRRETGT